MATRDFKNIPGAAKPGQATDLGKRNQDIDKYLADQIEKPEIADAAKQTYTQQTVQQNELLQGATQAAPKYMDKLFMHAAHRKMENDIRYQRRARDCRSRV